MLQIYTQMETKLLSILDGSFNCKLPILKLGYIGFCWYPIHTQASSTRHFFHCLVIQQTCNFFFRLFSRFFFFLNYMRRGLQFAISLLQLHLSSFSIILLHNSCNLTGSESVILSSLRPFFACIHSFFSFFITIFLASSSRLSLSFNSLTSQQRRPLIRIRACISAPWLALLFAHKSKPTLAITHFYAQPTPSVGDSAIHPSF